jgi:hypothetical protein
MYRPNTEYTYNGDGWEQGAIILKLYNDEGMRTIYIDKADMGTANPWKIAQALTGAYERGRREAMEDMRRLIGAKGVDDKW